MRQNISEKKRHYRKETTLAHICHEAFDKGNCQHILYFIAVFVLPKN
jgi:hypothetical protein